MTIQYEKSDGVEFFMLEPTTKLTHRDDGSVQWLTPIEIRFKMGFWKSLWAAWQLFTGKFTFRTSLISTFPQSKS